MKEQFFKVTLKSDVVLNSRLATEGNMKTLDYIPGSNFLGIVAAQLYGKLTPEEAFEIFHSGNVSFGDATISNEHGELSYPIPFDYMMEKGKDQLGENQVYLQHLLNSNNYPKEQVYKVQLKQQRSGFITPTGKAITKIKKTFALKSAQDAEKRRSKDGAMFGYESLKAGQDFIFSVQAKDENILNRVVGALTGNKRIGKSKTAQYGQVFIEAIDKPQQIATFDSSEFSLVYVQSNLCIINAPTGQPTLQPSSEDLDLKGKIDWSKSVIRSYLYSPWNGKRNTSDSLRTCIAAGSVLYIEGQNEAGGKSVGAYQAEGLGRIIINPKFLDGNVEDAICDFVKKNENAVENANESNKVDLCDMTFATELGNFLKQKAIDRQNELELSKGIQKEYSNATTGDGKGRYQKVTSSQWGAIRAYAIKAKSFDGLKESLLEGENAYLKHGVAYDRIWSRGKNLENMRAVFNKAEKSSNPTLFIAKFAALMAKYEQKEDYKIKTE